MHSIYYVAVLALKRAGLVSTFQTVYSTRLQEKTKELLLFIFTTVCETLKPQFRCYFKCFCDSEYNCL